MHNTPSAHTCFTHSALSTHTACTWLHPEHTYLVSTKHAACAVVDPKSGEVQEGAHVYCPVLRCRTPLFHFPAGGHLCPFCSRAFFTSLPGPFEDALKLHECSLAAAPVSTVPVEDQWPSPPTRRAPIAPTEEQLRQEPWYHGQMSRRAAEKLLRADGDFLVRDSVTNPGQYVLTGMHAGQPKHLLLVDPEGVVRGGAKGGRPMRETGVTQGVGIWAWPGSKVARTWPLLEGLGANLVWWA